VRRLSSLPGIRLKLDNSLVESPEDLLGRCRSVISAPGPFQSGLVAHLFKEINRSEKPQLVLQAWTLLRNKGIVPSHEVTSGMLAALVRLGRLSDAQKALVGLHQQGLALQGCYGPVISGFAKRNALAKAQACWELMMEHQTKPTYMEYSAMIGAFARFNKLDEALDLFTALKKSGMAIETEVCNAILSGCAEAMRPEIAAKVVRLMETKKIAMDVFTYASLINLYARTHNLAHCLKIFNKMMACKITPDVFVFVGLLKACRNVVNVPECNRIWFIMTNDFKIQPNQWAYIQKVLTFAGGKLYDDAVECILTAPPDMIDRKLCARVLMEICLGSNIVAAKRLWNYMNMREFVVDESELHGRMFSLLVSNDEPDLAFQLLENAVKRGVSLLQKNFNLLFSYAMQRKNVDLALKTWELMNQAGKKPSGKTFDLFTATSAAAGELELAMDSLKVGIGRKFIPSAAAVIAVLDAIESHAKDGAQVYSCLKGIWVPVLRKFDFLSQKEVRNKAYGLLKFYSMEESQMYDMDEEMDNNISRNMHK